MASAVVHFEVHADDLERAKRFYGDVLGWAFSDVDAMDYALVYPGGEVQEGPATVGINGGMLLRQGSAAAGGQAAPNAFVCTVAVDDLDATLEKVTANGGSVETPAETIPGVGRLAYARDTELNLIGPAAVQIGEAVPSTAHARQHPGLSWCDLTPLCQPRSRRSLS